MLESNSILVKNTIPDNRSAAVTAGTLNPATTRTDKKTATVKGLLANLAVIRGSTICADVIFMESPEYAAFPTDTPRFSVSPVFIEFNKSAVIKRVVFIGIFSINRTLDKKMRLIPFVEKSQIIKREIVLDTLATIGTVGFVFRIVTSLVYFKKQVFQIPGCSIQPWQALKGSRPSSPLIVESAKPSFFCGPLTLSAIYIFVEAFFPGIRHYGSVRRLEVSLLLWDFPRPDVRAFP